MLSKINQSYIGIEQAVLIEAFMHYVELPTNYKRSQNTNGDFSIKLFEEVLKDNRLDHLPPKVASALTKLVPIEASQQMAMIVPQLCENRTKNAVRNLLIQRQAMELTEALTNEGLHPIFLKGSIRLFDHTWPSMADRRMTDIDLLLPESELDDCVDVIRQLGYDYYNNPVSGFHPNQYRLTDHHHLPAMVRLDNLTAVSVEIHHQIGTSAVQKLLPAEDVISQAVSLTVNERINLLVPCNQHQAIHGVIQASNLIVNGQRRFLPVLPIVESILLLTRLRPEETIDLKLSDPLTTNYIDLLTDLTSFRLPIQYKSNTISIFRRQLYKQSLICRSTKINSIFCRWIRVLLILDFRLCTEGFVAMMSKKGKIARIKRYLENIKS